jgi:hypothetical protein
LKLTVEMDTNPVPLIVSVCAATPAVAEVGERLVIAGCGFVTAIGVDPDLVESSVEVAMIVAVPVPAGVNTPALVTVPMLVGLTDHVTEELKLPVPFTVGVQVDVCVVRMDVGEQLTETDVIVGETGGVPPPPLPPPPQPATTVKIPVVNKRAPNSRPLRNEW